MLVGIFFGKKEKGSGGIPFPQLSPRPASSCFAGIGGHGCQVNSQLSQTPVSKETQELKFQFTTTLFLPLPLPLLKIVKKESIFLASLHSVQHIRTVS